MNFRASKIPFLMTSVVSLLAACGGGGSNSPAPPPPNRAPVLVTTSFAATEDTPFTGQIVATDADNNPLTFTRVNDVQHGTLTIAANGAVSYAPATNYAGADSFGVRVSDGAGGEITGTINLTVAAVNDLPALTTLQFTATEDTTLSVALGGTDVEGAALSFTRVTDVQHGALTLAANGALTYLPASNYYGSDSFSVRISDGAGGESTSSVAITVAAVNDTPTITTAGVTVNEDSTLSQQLTAADVEGDPLAFSLVTPPAHGQATVTGPGTLSYTPVANYYGDDSVAVRVSDGTSASNSTLNIVVNSVNTPPVAADDEFRIATGAPMTFAVTANDVETEGETLTVSVETQPTGGTVAAGANNVLTFTPENGFTGPISFSYRITDARGGQDVANVRALIGTFQGIVWLGDDLNPGRYEILRFDGLNVSRVVPASPAFYDITAYSISGDGRMIAYVSSGPQQDDVWFKALDSPGPGVIIYSTFAPMGGPFGTQSLVLNHSGSYVLVRNRYVAGPKRQYVVNTANGSSDLLGGDEAAVTDTPFAMFNPYNDTQLVVQGQIGGTTPPDFQAESYTLFTANAAAPRTLTQISGDYPQLNGSGSGFGTSFYFGGNGRYIYHGEDSAIDPDPQHRQALLVWDTVTQTESVMYRRPVGTERGTGGVANISPDGSKVCFPFGSIHNSMFIGPAGFFVGSGADPVGAYGIGPLFPSTGNCWYGSDNNTVVMAGRTASADRTEMYSMSSVLPATETQLSHALVPNEMIFNTWVARSAMRTILGYRISPATVSDLYIVPTAGGPERLFANNFPNATVANDNINADGTLLAYGQLEGGLLKLRLLSTQTLNYSVPISLSGGSRHATQFRWLPAQP